VRTGRRAPPDEGDTTLARSTIGAFNAETAPMVSTRFSLERR